MRTLAKCFTYIAGLLLVVAIAFQVLAIGSIHLYNPELLETLPWLLTGWILALVCVSAAFVWLLICKERGGKPIVSMVVGLVGALLGLLVALALKDAFPAKIASDGVAQGLTTWRLLYRHVSSVAAGVLIAAASLLHNLENRAQRIREESGAYRSTYSLDGAPLFKDESTLGLDTYAGKEESLAPAKRKRSVRHAQKKAAPSRD